MQNEPKIIDHNPDERRPGNGIWWALWIIVALGWIWYFIYREFDRDALALGAVTGMVITLWGIEMSDNKAPAWMIPKPRKKYLPPPILGEPAFGSNAKRFAVLIASLLAIVAAFMFLRF